MNDVAKIHNGTNPILISALFIIAMIPGAVALFLQAQLTSGSPLSQNTLVIGGKNGSKIVATTAGDGAPRALFYDAAGNALLTTQLTPTGVPMISLDTPTGGRAISISTALSGGRPQIMLFNPETGKPAWSIRIDENGKPIMLDHTVIED